METNYPGKELKAIFTDEELQGVEYLKLERNSKGYNWSIKLNIKEGKSDDEHITRLSNINSKLANKYGSMNE